MNNVLFTLIIISVFALIAYFGSSFYLIKKLIKDKSSIFIDTNLNFKEELAKNKGYKIHYKSDNDSKIIISDKITPFNFGYFYLIEFYKGKYRIYIRPRIFYDFIKYRKINRLEKIKNNLFS